MVMIEEKTRIGKGTPQNGLELKVSRLVGFIQSKLNQVEVFHHQDQSIFQVVEYVKWETQWLHKFMGWPMQEQLPVVRLWDVDELVKK